MSLKDLLITNYGISLYKKTSRLQDQVCKQATAKNQVVFLTRCLYHNIFPRFLQIHSPIKSKYATNVTLQFKRKLLVCAVKEAKVRHHKCIREIENLTHDINNIVSREHYDLIMNLSESCRRQSSLK